MGCWVEGSVLAYQLRFAIRKASNKNVSRML